MLPRIISSDVASLNTKGEKVAISVYININKNGLIDINSL